MRQWGQKLNKDLYLLLGLGLLTLLEQEFSSKIIENDNKEDENYLIILKEFV
jgi:hypothetical protein